MPDWKLLWQNLEHVVLRGTWAYYRPITEEERGTGQVAYPNGSVYTGEYLKDKPHGRGKLDYYDGSVYEGDFEAGFFCGQGKYTKVDGTSYEGAWLNGKPDGQGRAIFPDKSTYEGAFVEGVPDGEGALVDYGPANAAIERVKKAYDPWDADGAEPDLNFVPYTYTGQWMKGKEHGTGEDQRPDGSTYRGIYAEGARSAQGTSTTPDGSTYEGGWINGKKHGLGRELLADGTVFQGEFLKDRHKHNMIEDTQPRVAAAEEETAAEAAPTE